MRNLQLSSGLRLLSHGHRVCSEPHMGETRFELGRFVLAGILPAVMLAACGSPTASEHQNEGGAGAVAGEATGGSRAGSGSGGSKADSGTGGANAGSGSGGVSGGAVGGSGSGGNLNHAGSGGWSANAGAAGSSGANAGGAGGEPLACGSMTCGAAQYCVIPCCGGTAPACFPASTDGKCPTGSHSGCTTNPTACTSPASCCQQDDCTAPPPFCSDAVPSMCFSSQGLPGPPKDRICQKMCA